MGLVQRLRRTVDPNEAVLRCFSADSPKRRPRNTPEINNLVEFLRAGQLLKTRMETRRNGVQVILIEPGAVATPFWQRAQDDLPALRAADAGAYDRVARLLTRIQRSAGGPHHRQGSERPAPARRYTVGIDAHLGTALQHATPLWLSDHLKSCLSALHTPAAAVPTPVGQASDV
ncbi:SDR family oxidoreductase [Kitasatospora purpeofusca]|uniref:hypothetical protein n=1 Tax=Kitasatospora purpeofusca TaxID=67352 RepID=UPI0036571FF8